MEAARSGDGGIVRQFQWWCAGGASRSDVYQPVCAVRKHYPILVCASVLGRSDVCQLREGDSTLKQDGRVIVQSSDKPHSLDQWKADQRRCARCGNEVGIDGESFQSVCGQVRRATKFSSGDDDGVDADWVDEVLRRCP